MAHTLNARLIKRFPGGPMIRLEEMCLTGEGGRVTVLFGESGCGKTTVLRCLAGLEHPEEGRIEFGKQTWFDSQSHQFLEPQQRNVGFVQQDYVLFPHLSVAGNVGFGLNQMSAAERRARVQELLCWVGLDGLGRRLPRELSGGQQQRVALARAVARRPCLLLLDEPLSALDAPARQRMRGELRHLLRQLQIPTLLVTHDRTETIALGDDLLVMARGQVVQQGPVNEVFSRPGNLAAAAILAVETIQPGQVLAVADGFVTVAVGDKRFMALERSLSPGLHEVFVCIRAEDVILSKPASAASSPRNRLPATVRALSPEGPMIRIDLDCGFPLAALLTKQACEELEVRVGDLVVALIKVPHVHLIPRER
jgi:molybdate transport system ATP-binding protein